jgi:hypothetical protein
MWLKPGKPILRFFNPAETVRGQAEPLKGIVPGIEHGRWPAAPTTPWLFGQALERFPRFRAPEA